MPDTYTAKAIHERFLAAPNLRLVPDGQIVRNTILKAVEKDKIVVRLPDGRAYDNQGCVQGPDGQRRRTNTTLTGIGLNDDVLITRAGSTSAGTWLKEDAAKQDEEGGKVDVIPPPPPPSASGATATSWEQLIELAASRPLLELRLIARTPSAAATLAGLAQPLGADGLSLSIQVGGNLKDSGKMNFAASDVGLNHPTKPMNTAQTIFNALNEAASYETTLKLSFGAAGRTNMKDLLQSVKDNAPDGVQVLARFDQATGVTA
jgi:hypothetical protein